MHYLDLQRQISKCDFIGASKEEWIGINQAKGEEAWLGKHIELYFLGLWCNTTDKARNLCHLICGCILNPLGLFPLAFYKSKFNGEMV